MSTTKIETSQPPGPSPEWLTLVRRQVGSLRYGAVEIVVHDSQVIQIERSNGSGWTNKAPDKTGGHKPKFRTELEP